MRPISSIHQLKQIMTNPSAIKYRRLMLFNEPSMGLSPLLVKGDFRILQEINAQGTTILLVKQNADMALKIAHRGYVLENGRIILGGSVAQLAQTPESKKPTSASSRRGVNSRVFIFYDGFIRTDFQQKSYIAAPLFIFLFPIKAFEFEQVDKIASVVAKNCDAMPHGHPIYKEIIGIARSHELTAASRISACVADRSRGMDTSPVCLIIHINRRKLFSAGEYHLNRCALLIFGMATYIKAACSGIITAK